MTTKNSPEDGSEKENLGDVPPELMFHFIPEEEDKGEKELTDEVKEHLKSVQGTLLENPITPDNIDAEHSAALSLEDKSKYEEEGKK